jgi:hypothetical protein
VVNGGAEVPLQGCAYNQNTQTLIIIKIKNKKVQFALLIKFTPGTLERWCNLYFGQK